VPIVYTHVEMTRKIASLVGTRESDFEKRLYRQLIIAMKPLYAENLMRVVSVSLARSKVASG
jgi:hypothetical protein